ncbi:MAG: DUF222 domain-containing protein [Actinomycetota bacterium]|nr:DUF222 domain-containing protein [Actinomycetota bacterium]
MFDEEVTGLDAEQTLSAAGAARRLADRNEAFILTLAAHFADLHPVTDDDHLGRLGGSLPGMERMVVLGGDGTPGVAEFAAAELGAELEVSPFAACRLIGDALELRHRLPGLWARVHAGEVRPWVARKIAQATTRHAAQVAAAVDAKVTRWADSVGWSRLEPILDAAIIAADPVAAEARARRAATEQGVWVGRSDDHGIKSIVIKTQTPNAVFFDATVNRIADGLALLGDADGRDVRRAKAVGVIANPQQALQLFDHVADTADAHGHPTDDPAGAVDDIPTGDPTPFIRPSRLQCECGCHTGPRVDPARLLPSAILYLHLNEDSFTRDGAGVARFEGHGPITVGQARDFLAHSHVTIKPVIDPHNQAPVDAYEIPDRLREAVQLRSPVECSPTPPTPAGRWTKTTPSPTSHPTTADHPARPASTTSAHSPVDTTGSRPTADGRSNNPSTASSCGDRPTAATTSSTTPAPTNCQELAESRLAPVLSQGTAGLDLEEIRLKSG